MKDMKKHKTEVELCQYLFDTKNIKDIFCNKSIISDRSYVSSINPYKKIFSSGEDISADEYRKLIVIDDMLLSN